MHLINGNKEVYPVHFLKVFLFAVSLGGHHGAKVRRGDGICGGAVLPGRGNHSASGDTSALQALFEITPCRGRRALNSIRRRLIYSANDTTSRPEPIRPDAVAKVRHAGKAKLVNQGVAKTGCAVAGTAMQHRGRIRVVLRHGICRKFGVCAAIA